MAGGAVGRHATHSAGRQQCQRRGSCIAPQTPMQLRATCAPPGSPPFENPVKPPTGASGNKQPCYDLALDGVSTDSDEDDVWISALEDACELVDEITVDADAGTTAELPPEVATALQGIVGGLPPPPSPRALVQLVSASSDADESRAETLLRWLGSLPDGMATMDGVCLGTGRHGAGLFASRDLPAGHEAIKIHPSLFVSQARARSLAQKYHGVGHILERVAQQASRPLGDGRWSLKCSRVTTIALFLICERARVLKQQQERQDTGQTLDELDNLMARDGILSGWVCSLPGFGSLTSPISALQEGWEQRGEQRTSDDPQFDLQIAAAAKQLREHAAETDVYVATELRRGPLALYFPSKIFSTRAVRWAVGNIYSRSFNAGGACITICCRRHHYRDTLLMHTHLDSLRIICDADADVSTFTLARTGSKLMLPLIDMLNHATCGSDEHNTGVEFAQSGAIATTSKPVPKVNDHASGARAGLWRERVLGK